MPKAEKARKGKNAKSREEEQDQLKRLKKKMKDLKCIVGDMQIQIENVEEENGQLKTRVRWEHALNLALEKKLELAEATDPNSKQ